MPKQSEHWHTFRNVAGRKTFLFCPFIRNSHLCSRQNVYNQVYKLTCENIKENGNDYLPRAASEEAIPEGHGRRSHQLLVESAKINYWLVSKQLFFYYTDGKEDKSMNQETIGKFVATCRKEKGFTQKQLAEKLNITDRAVSKWETGKSIPDAAIMLDLCKILGISANELLSGERIAMENYQKKAEENLVELQQKANNAQKSSNLLVKFVALILGVLFIVKYGIGSKASYFVDSISMEFILIPCLLMLLCTGYWRGFLQAFAYFIRRNHCTAERLRDSANALKLVCRSSLIWGSIGFTISTVNLMRHHMPDPKFGALCGDLSVALLPLFYSLVINAVLMPLYFELNRFYTKNAE